MAQTALTCYAMSINGHKMGTKVFRGIVPKFDQLTEGHENLSREMTFGGENRGSLSRKSEMTLREMDRRSRLGTRTEGQML